MSIGMAQPKAAVEQWDAVAEMAVDLAAEVILGMQCLGDETERNGFAGRLQAKHPVHRCRPLDVAAREIPPPVAAAGKSLGEFLGQGTIVLAPNRRPEMSKAAGK